MRVLIIEDDNQLNFAITSFLKMLSFEVISLKDGGDAIDLIDKNGFDNFDLYIIDINIPSFSGIEVLKYIRHMDDNVPIILITASIDITYMVSAYENSCSEYIKKPFHLKELELRINKILKNKLSLEKILFSEDFFYDITTWEFYNFNKKIDLRHQEKLLCKLLISNINKIVPNERIYEYIWGSITTDSFPLRQLVNSIRKKLPLNIIQTKIKEGYMIETH